MVAVAVGVSEFVYVCDGSLRFELSLVKKAPSVGIEPTAIGLKGQRSTI